MSSLRRGRGRSYLAHPPDLPYPPDLPLQGFRVLRVHDLGVADAGLLTPCGPCVRPATPWAPL